MATISGGRRLEVKLSNMARKMTSGTVRVGFLESSIYPVNEKGKSLPVATVAFWNNFGTSRAPARPFFSNTVRDKSPEWGNDLAKIAAAVGYETRAVLAAMGARIKDQIVKAIVDWPADNAPSTVRIKGFNKGLIHRGTMQREVGYEVLK